MIDIDIDTDIDGTDLDTKIEQSLAVCEKIKDGFETPVFACSFGKDSNAVLDLAERAGLDLGGDTTAAFMNHGNHFEETWAVKDELEAEYDLEFESYEPESSYEDLVAEHGPLVNRRKPELCCTTLKSKTMERVIKGHDSWITGYRIAESRGDGDSYDWRDELEFFDRKDDIVRVNPIVHWTDEDVWNYHDRNDIPYNDLYDEGFDCLGCKQCTLDGDALFAYDSLRRVGDSDTEASG
ncbi:phosphoadenosine phosphosulfate reductase family protein [Halocatena salina]|uniref:Phosphoadenosine phosphosulfate reductase family protein n=1 Tax=Halocatena salina TaxID=2934340 RepID=A0A8U0A0L2_9EURY|nr:phosphoadenosine phosphosulfate reductase family protein [Halocatena salina]UPM42614.1 phosphoadenosine phosphosulfate reductase family protein [Halocatena salina]